MEWTTIPLYEDWDYVSTVVLEGGSYNVHLIYSERDKCWTMNLSLEQGEEIVVGQRIDIRDAVRINTRYLTGVFWLEPKYINANESKLHPSLIGKYFNFYYGWGYIPEEIDDVLLTRETVDEPEPPEPPEPVIDRYVEIIRLTNSRVVSGVTQSYLWNNEGSSSLQAGDKLEGEWWMYGLQNASTAFSASLVIRGVETTDGVISSYYDVDVETFDDPNVRVGREPVGFGEYEHAVSISFASTTTSSGNGIDNNSMKVVIDGVVTLKNPTGGFVSAELIDNDGNVSQNVEYLGASYLIRDGSLKSVLLRPEETLESLTYGCSSHHFQMIPKPDMISQTSVANRPRIRSRVYGSKTNTGEPMLYDSFTDPVDRSIPTPVSHPLGIARGTPAAFELSDIVVNQNPIVANIQLKTKGTTSILTSVPNNFPVISENVVGYVDNTKYGIILNPCYRLMQYGIDEVFTDYSDQNDLILSDVLGTASIPLVDVTTETQEIDDETVSIVVSYSNKTLRFIAKKWVPHYYNEQEPEPVVWPNPWIGG